MLPLMNPPGIKVVSIASKYMISWGGGGGGGWKGPGATDLKQLLTQTN